MLHHLSRGTVTFSLGAKAVASSEDSKIGGNISKSKRPVFTKLILWTKIDRAAAAGYMARGPRQF